MVPGPVRTLLSKSSLGMPEQPAVWEIPALDSTQPVFWLTGASPVIQPGGIPPGVVELKVIAFEHTVKG